MIVLSTLPQMKHLDLRWIPQFSKSHSPAKLMVSNEYRQGNRLELAYGTVHQAPVLHLGRSEILHNLFFTPDFQTLFLNLIKTNPITHGKLLLPFLHQICCTVHQLQFCSVGHTLDLHFNMINKRVKQNVILRHAPTRTIHSTLTNWVFDAMNMGCGYSSYSSDSISKSGSKSRGSSPL